VDVGEPVTFDGSNSKGEGTLEYFFDFGNGQDSGWITQSITTHTYDSAGTYLASLRIRDQFGNVSTNSAEVTITVENPNVAPVAYIDQITPNSTTVGEQVTFTGHGYDEDGYIAYYLWESTIDGIFSDENTFTSSLLSEGSHTIYFRVQDDRGDWSEPDQTSLEIGPEIVNRIPVAIIESVSPNPAFEGDTVTFSGYGVDEDGSITSYSWTSSIGGELSDKSSFSASYLSLGIHTISFSVEDDNQTWSQGDEMFLTIKSIPPNQPPSATIESISPNPATEGDIIYFSGHGEDEDGSIDMYYWESDIHGMLSSKSSFGFSSLTPGEHTITFKVRDDSNDWSEPDTMTLTIKEKENDEEDERLFYVLIGAILLGLIAIFGSIFALVSKRKKNEGFDPVNCPRCGIAFMVGSPKRPIMVQCPYCRFSTTIE
jgi:hypothetical protein